MFDDIRKRQAILTLMRDVCAYTKKYPTAIVGMMMLDDENRGSGIIGVEMWREVE